MRALSAAGGGGDGGTVVVPVIGAARSLLVADTSTGVAVDAAGGRVRETAAFGGLTISASKLLDGINTHLSPSRGAALRISGLVADALRNSFVVASWRIVGLAALCDFPPLLFSLSFSLIKKGRGKEKD